MKNTAAAEFIALAAMLISLVALSIDSMLPALPAIAAEFNLVDPNDQQYIITGLFLGLGVGQLIYGPLSDAYGRKGPIYVGIGIFVLGSVLCLLTPTYELLLVGRFLQGLGASSARIVTLAIVRDRFEGAAMARVMSFVMAVFIFIPALAPLLGQSILFFGDWHLIFAFILLYGLVAVLWLGLRLEESLPVARRHRLSLKSLWQGTRFIFQQPVSVIAILISGLLFGGFVAYLSNAQQILGELYQTGDAFALYFALLALGIGAASIANARILSRLGILQVCVLALSLQCGMSLVMLVVSVWLYDQVPPLWLFMLYCFPLFFCLGLQFGNINALAMQPLGNIAGLGASVSGAVSTMIAVPLGALVGQHYNGTPVPLIASFLVFGGVGLMALAWLSKRVEHI
ncbi:multidrug effflux MFS transporter [Ketobacter sp.]|uniref:multidrug effflux MFS transporter n=1 Tax=Ketobacter sp. TaxID=2083498 RepID=UPI0025C2CB8D|nr:multidrug effflux MFS transporter [Ketobacter sp.]